MAEQAMGVYSKLLLAYETEYGKDPANLSTATVVLPFNSCNVSASQNKTDPGTITGRRDSVEPIMGNIDVGGDIVVPMDATAIGYWLKAAFGEPTTTDGTVLNTHKHIFKPPTQQPSFILEKVFSNVIMAHYNGCKVSKISLSVGGDGEVVATISVMGANETINKIAMSASPTAPLMDRLNNFMASLKIGSATMAIATALSIDIDFGLDGDTYTIGSNGYRSRVNEGIIGISGSLTAFFEDDKYIALAETSTTTAIELKFAVGDMTLDIKFPEIKFSRNTPAIDGAAGIKQELQYSAFLKNNSDDSSIVITLVNKTASYVLPKVK